MKCNIRSLNIYKNIVQAEIEDADVADVKNIIKYAEGGKKVSLELKREKRSNDANAYLWVLCTKLAESLSKDGCPLTKNDVYRQAVRDYGKYDILSLNKGALDFMKCIWKQNSKGRGLGWFLEVVGDTPNTDNNVTVFAYYGTSDYDSKEMSQIIEGLISECKQQVPPIPTRPPEEIEKLVREWGLRK